MTFSSLIVVVRGGVRAPVVDDCGDPTKYQEKE